MATLVLFLALIALVVMGATVLQGRLQFGYVIPSATVEAAVLSSWYALCQTPEKRLALECWLTRQRRRHSPEFQAAKAARKLARSQQSAADKAAWQKRKAKRDAFLAAEAEEAWLAANPISCGLDFRAHDRWVRKQARLWAVPKPPKPPRPRRPKRTPAPAPAPAPTPTPAPTEVIFEVLYPVGGKTYEELRAQQFAWAKAREAQRAFRKAEAARRSRRALDRQYALLAKARRKAVATVDPRLTAWEVRVQETLLRRQTEQAAAEKKAALLAEAARLDALTLLERKRSEAARKGWETRRRNAEMAAAAAGVLH